MDFLTKIWKKNQADQKRKAEREALEKLLPTLFQNAVALDFEGSPSGRCGDTRFGGAPDVPKDFVWPYYTTSTYEDSEEKPRPLAFLAQFDLSQVSVYDKEELLPKTGVLSFFYELESQCWGFDPKDKGCARVFLFEDASSLRPMSFPEDLPEEFRLESAAIRMRSAQTLPDWEDFLMIEDAVTSDYAVYYDVKDALLPQISDSALLGYPIHMQGNMTSQCELISRGFYLGSDWSEISESERAAADRAFSEWQLLFQLGSERELMFGDCGRIYFYIRKDDLAARRFERVWLILQCG